MNNVKTNDLIVLIDKRIHEKADLKKMEFIRRIGYVKGIRTNFNTHLLSYYITSLEEYNWFDKFYKIVNTGEFDINYLTDEAYYIFAIAIKPKLYSWFKNNSLDTIKKQIINWIAAKYFYDIEKRDIIKDQIYKPILDEALKLVDLYYKKNEDNENQQEIYYKVSNDYVGSRPPEFLNYFYDFNSCGDNWGISNFNFIIIESFFTDHDWNYIVLKDINRLRKRFNHSSYTDEKLLELINQKDDLIRAESSIEMWEKWKQTYIIDDDKNNYVFSILSSSIGTLSDSKGFIYLIRKENTNICKIGWTKNENVDKRISSIQTSNPQKIEKLGMFQVTSINTEKTLHNYFSAQRLTGEWFDLTDLDIENILSSDWRVKNNIF